MALEITKILESRFEFSLDNGDPISDNAPSLTTFGNVCHFKTSNGASIIREQNITHADITLIDTFGGTGTFTNFANVQNLWTKLIELNFFAGVNSVQGGSGVTRFDALLDAFQYFGNNGKVPVVDESQSKLIPTDFYNINKLLQLSDVSISSLVEGKYLKVENVEGELKIVLSDVPTNTSSSNMKKIIIVAEENQTEINVDNSPNNIFLFKNGSWQIEDSDYSYSSGVVTSLQSVNEGDYFEIIPLTNDILKIIVQATADNQTEFNFNGNPSFADAYLKGSRLREGTDYTRTLFSSDNKITIINQSLVDYIETGDTLEIITY